MSTKNTRTAVYLRQSLDATGEELAVQRQREDCRRIAEARGWEIVQEYVDNSISASDERKRRPAYNRLVEDYEAGHFDAIVCWDLDRLTRQPRQLEDWIDAAEKRGLLLVTANGEADLQTDNGQTFARIKLAVAKGEVKRKSVRQRRANLQRSEMGRPPLGVRLTGYTVKGDIVPAEAEFVRAAFERFAAGDSLRSITAWANEQGVPTRHGRPWNPSSIRTLLTNPRFAGRAVYQGSETGRLGGWEPVVEDDLFAIVQVKLSDPGRKTQHGTDRRHLGSGLYVCGVCGRALVSWTGNRYRCQDGHLTRAMAGIDDYVSKVVRMILARPDLADLVPVPSAADREAGGRVRELRQRIARVAADYDADLIDGHRFKVATERAKDELRAAEAAMQRAANPTASVLLAHDPVAVFDASPLMVRRAIIGALCTVHVHPAPRGRRAFDPDSVQVEPVRGHAAP
ncbi:recombinase family protein [Sinomonas sp. ASV486]|uniref:recombinase family protein n=1 Tax=Sinomonas sp. ASV486 TaxID=3051170 RepID=UPI0027DC2CD6|nr:recombinase family protein [Sinomonas sp. ASV486]MDQ4491120.1 recombinase family protein [Sinomonas sp. ASV486]